MENGQLKQVRAKPYRLDTQLIQNPRRQMSNNWSTLPQVILAVILPGQNYNAHKKPSIYKFNCDGRLESLPKRLVRVKDLQRTRTQHGSQGKITREISLLKELLNLKMRSVHDALLGTQCGVRAVEAGLQICL